MTLAEAVLAHVAVQERRDVGRDVDLAVAAALARRSAHAEDALVPVEIPEPQLSRFVQAEAAAGEEDGQGALARLGGIDEPGELDVLEVAAGRSRRSAGGAGRRRSTDAPR